MAEARPEVEAILEAEATAEAQTATLETATPEVEAAEAATAQVPDPLTADNLASLPDHSIKYHPAPESILTSTASTSLSLHRPDHVSTYSLEEMTVGDARNLLNRNHLYMFDSDTQKRAKEIIKAGNQIRERRRKSAMPDPISMALVETI